MADTLSVDTAVKFAIERGASVRLVGDDQQLAAIGAGGVQAAQDLMVDFMLQRADASSTEA
jgi:hypothetical protein